ncbi:thioesterase family protein [Arthrobacter sp. S39]|uniref:acyl-CoA thioesterase n=1 Tax=Arthrobacter sp. S39 TaxID=2509720 RepID=UPI001037C27A|nr:thioesterase family protein [Arthrobacter sp. S39]TAP43201.1 acyl-CoA thioesterase [Arthrobacter sp. S39]
MTSTVNATICTHYYQFDQQGVAFNMWYLAFAEEARNAFLAEEGFPLTALLASGHDVQVVHVEIDWMAALRWGDELMATVSAGRTGTTSFTLSFSFGVSGQDRARASITYVVIDAMTQKKAPLPAELRSLLERGSRLASL